MKRQRALRVVSIVLAAILVGVVSTTTPAATPWRFIAVGDSRGGDNGINATIVNELATQIVNSGAEFVVFPGDLVEGYNSQAALESQLLTWRNAMQPVYNAGIEIYAVRGNHDLGSPVGVTAWNNVFSGVYAMPNNGPAGEVNLTYSVTRNNVFIVGFDQYVNAHRVNQTWLNAQFAANTQPHVFTFGHEPAFKADHADCLGDYPADRNTFWASLRNEGSRVYFAGHDHFYDRARVNDGDGNPNNDLYQYIVGTAGAPLRDWAPPYNGTNAPYTVERQFYEKQYGYVLVEINGLNVTLTWMKRSAPGVYVPGGDVWSYTVIPEPATAGIVLFGAMVAVLVFRFCAPRPEAA